ncbi:MAG: LysM peptidoglycan-binding domain-containing protein [Burkholderiales bacterium]
MRKTLHQFIIPLVLVVCALGVSARADDMLVDNPPDQYTVVKGDTLWGIAGKFLRKPQRWPEIWQMNQSQIKDPHWIYPGDVVYLDRSGATPRLTLGRPVANGNSSDGTTIKVSPQIRGQGLGAGAIPSIPASAIEPFLTRPLIVEAGALVNAPVVLGTEEGRVVIGTGNIIYVENLNDDRANAKWQIYRQDKPLRDPDNGELLGYEAFYLGDAVLKKFGPVSTMEVTRSIQEINRGDHLIAVTENPFPSYVPRSPQYAVNARLMHVHGGVAETGKHYVVSLNKGATSGVELGHVLTLQRSGETVKSLRRENTLIKLPDEENGEVFIFRLFNRISYGIIMNSKRPVHVGDGAISSGK